MQILPKGADGFSPYLIDYCTLGGCLMLGTGLICYSRKNKGIQNKEEADEDEEDAYHQV